MHVTSSIETDAQSSSALYFYDRVLTFGQEVDLIWRRERIGIAVPTFYVTLHASMILDFILDIATLPSGLPPEVRDALVTMCLAFSAITLSVISAARIYAINGKHYTVPSIIMGLWFVPIAVNIVSALHGVASTAFAGQIATRIGLVAADALVLLVTWRITGGVRKLAQVADVKISISVLLLRDGMYTSGINCYVDY
ncbi:uncharacterized protein B0H18DRAFT_884664 [Fomitopsis serialis]|uniref:uncharacterized protein n=1 Tax=Fomitopsis serialis TaxID=139415 RepID=UPI0020076B42|nr:uncharacterized protein B0H18DRAFT_884664 [Neoantrodia serialis]KAH9916645.1 hypothetical protein B0H18DRAFT_884664 [Neoantrodia serialis]